MLGRESSGYVQKSWGMDAQYGFISQGFFILLLPLFQLAMVVTICHVHPVFRFFFAMFVAIPTGQYNHVGSYNEWQSRQTRGKSISRNGSFSGCLLSTDHLIYITLRLFAVCPGSPSCRSHRTLLCKSSSAPFHFIPLFRDRLLSFDRT